MATSSSSLSGNWLQLDDSSTLSTASGNSGTATAAMMQQASQLQQLQNQQLGATYPYNSAPNPYANSAPNPYAPTPYTSGNLSTLSTTVDYPELKQILTLQVANLIANVGPLTAKRILMHYKIQCEDFDVIAKELVKIMNGDDDAELDKVINDAVKEVKL